MAQKAEGMRRGEWTPDEVVLTIEAWVQIREGADRKTTVDSLAKELNREPNAVDAAARAVGDAATPGEGPKAFLPLVALSPLFVGDRRRETRLTQMAGYIRDLWRQKG